MTEADWLASDDPAAMLRLYTSDDMPWPHDAPAPFVSDRKLRLFACACCRHVWDRLANEHSRRVVEVAERYADGEATVAEMRKADRAVTEAIRAAEVGPATWISAWVVDDSADWLDDALPNLLWLDREGQLSSAAQAALLRDIVGNPFRPGVILGSSIAHLKSTSTVTTAKLKDGRTVDVDKVMWLPREYLTPTVIGLAAAAYETRLLPVGELDAARLAVLADALEEAGCEADDCEACKGRGFVLYCRFCRSTLARGSSKTCSWCWSQYREVTPPPDRRGCQPCGGSGVDPHSLLSHLRSPGPHVRGCHAVDTILGKI